MAGGGGSGRAILAGEAAVRFKGDRRPLQSSMKAAERDLASFANKVNALGTGLAAAGAAITGALILPVRDFARIEQLLGRFSSVFGTLENDATQFAESLGKRINQSALDIRDQLAQFQSVLLGLGFEQTQAFTLSKDLTSLSQDLVAFDDTITSTQESTDKFLSAIAGEVRPARRIGGADIRQSALDAFLLSKGLAESADKATEAQRALARITIVSEAAGRAGITGQAEREVDTLAALFRAFRARILDLNFAIGQALAPQMQALTQEFNTLIDRTAAFIANNSNLVVMVGKLGLQMTGLGLALKGVGFFANQAARGLAAVRATVAALAAGKVTTIIAGIGLAFAALALHSERGRKGIAEAFDGMRERLEQTRDAILEALEVGQFRNAISLIAIAVEREVLNLALQFGNIGILVAAWFQESINRIKGLASILVRIVDTLANALDAAIGRVDDALELSVIDALEASVKQRLAELRQLENDIRGQVAEGQQQQNQPDNRAINNRRAEVLGQVQERLERVRLRGTLGREEFGAIGNAIAAALVKQEAPLARNFDRVAGTIQRQASVLLQGLRLTAEEGRNRRGERITELQNQAKAIAESVAQETAATFGGATRLAFGIGETKIEEDQLDELVKINEQLGKLGVGPAVILNNGT